MHNPKEDCLYEKAFSQHNREKYQSDKQGFRELYFELLQRLEAALWIEQILRSRVLVHDTPSVADRLRGAQLAEFSRVRAATSAGCFTPTHLEVNQREVLASMQFDAYYVGWPFVPDDKEVLLVAQGRLQP